MQNLKSVYDAVKAADEKVNQIAADMVAAFDEGTEEGKQKAFDMQPALKEAREEAGKLNDLYVSLKDAGGDVDGHARKFVPAGETPKAQAEDAKTKTRAEFEAMTHQERHQFFKDGGVLVEDVEEE